MIPVHSFTDLITNSSTVVYTYSEGAIKACQEMIDEFFKEFGIDKKCEDVFNLVLLREDSDSYGECFDRWLEENGIDPDSIDFQETMDKVLSGEIEKPKWVIEAETKPERNHWGEPVNRSSTNLYISAKSPENEPLAKLIRKFLYSTHHDAVYDG